MEHPEPRPPHAEPLSEVYTRLTASPAGLSDAEAALRLSRFGRNQLAARPPKSVARMIWEQISDPMVLILITAAAVSFLLQEWTEAGVITFIVVLNAVIGVVQEKKAQSSLAALKTLAAPTARVLREGEESVIAASELVPGDVVLLRDGDKVPADLRLIDAANLKIQEAALTGESLPVEKDADAVLAADAALGDRCNMAYSSSIVTYGRGTGLVTATGMDTEVGRIAGMLDSHDVVDTPLKRQLASLGKKLTLAGLVICVLIFAIGAFYGQPLVPQFLLAIALAISIIPEGLPATATIVMALGVERMAKKQALIRRLPAVETLGSATVIASDKTGTLTLNEMTVTALSIARDFTKGAYVPSENAADPAYRELLCGAALCNDASFDPDRPGAIIGDPTEGALIRLVKNAGIPHEELEKEHPRLFEQSFDSVRKRMTTVHPMEGGLFAYTKGSVDDMLPLCTQLLTEEGVRPLTEDDRAAILALSRRMSEDALRVLGFAFRPLSKVPEEDSNIENDLTFIGLVGMIDPPRREVADAIAASRAAGIRTVMITGDHPATAIAIARELGLYQEGNRCVTGPELAAMTDAELDAIVKSVTVFARVSPSDKLRIVRSLQRVGEIAAMTGDGVNDAPALKAADIGIAMGVTGTDVAKDAADMVLLDDRFTTITHAIKEGRRVYKNIRKVIQFLLSGNVAEVSALFLTTLVHAPAPLLAVHILWVNLATATLPALALGVDPASANTMKQPPAPRDTILGKAMIRRIAIQGFYTALMAIAAYWIGSAESHMVGQTMAFAVLALSQLFRAVNQRSDTQPIWNRAEGINPWLIAAILLSALLMAAILFIPSMQAAFQVTDLNASQWIAVLALSASTVVQMEVYKRILR